MHINVKNTGIFLYRFVCHLSVLLTVTIPLQLLGGILLAVYIPIHLQLIKHGLRQSIKLPWFLRWYDNVDIYIGRDSSTYLNVFGSGAWNLYCWLAWRNPLNYFGYKVLGVLNNTPETVEDSNVGDGTGQEPGLRHTEALGVYEYYYIKKWNATHCIRVRIGWKLGGVRPNEIAQWVFVVSPYHSYNGN